MVEMSPSMPGLNGELEVVVVRAGAAPTGTGPTALLFLGGCHQEEQVHQLQSIFGPTGSSYGTPGPAPGRYFAGGGGGGGAPCTPPNLGGRWKGRKVVEQVGAR
jgi:hypothetical protein